MEVRAQLYPRAVKFASQTALFDWIKQGRSSDMRQVTSLDLTLRDVDLSPVFGMDGGTGHPRKSAWDLYQQDLQKMKRALTALPSIQRLIITPPKTTNSSFLRIMYLSCLELIPQCCRILAKLTAHDRIETMKRAVNHGELWTVEFASPARAGKTRPSPRFKTADTRRQESVAKGHTAGFTDRKRSSLRKRRRTGATVGGLVKSSSRGKRKAKPS